MRASPAFQVSLRRFGAWRIGIGVLAALGASVLSAWLIARAPGVDLLVVIAVFVTSAAFVVMVVALMKMPAVSLRWDGQLWHLGALGAATDDAVPGELAVAIDLGSWMLLHFRPVEPRRRVLVNWLPVQRRGIEAQWHALRCAVHSPRAAATDAASGR